ncbi:Phosphatidylglycerophosphatase A [gamma proteobacterium IMCC2047]|nr:Phosphatidylglycerophosphatase A [gamma proteobacterium IMCC2047]
MYLPLQYLNWFSYLLVVVVAFVVGVLICERTSKDIGVHDHGGIVWDEFVGYWLTMLFAPPGWAWIVVGFVLFRLFDITKPPPIGWLDKQVKGGMGIMIDDVVAGIYALLCLQLLVRIFQG